MMDSQLVAGQWVEVSIEALPEPVLLSGFVLSTRAGELLLTFPELLSPPKGLEAEAQATLAYSNEAGRFAAVAHIRRVASGPPVTVTFKPLPARGPESRRAPLRMPAKFPVVLHALSSSVSSSAGAVDGGAWIEDVSASGMLLSTSLLLAVGDVLAVHVSANAESPDVHGRVIRVHEGDSGAEGRFGVGVLVQPRSEAERRSWPGLVGRLQDRVGR
jgi:hypothetical protein